MAIVTFDVNRDGRGDLGVANFLEDTVCVLIGLGGASFQAPRNFPVGVSPSELTTGDVNLDGLSDLVVANSQDNTIGVLLGRAAVGSGPVLSPQVTVATNVGTSGIAVGDMNGDGRPDLVVADSSGNSVRIVAGDAVWDGPLPTVATITVPGEPVAVAIGDLNRDGRNDLVAAAKGNKVVSVVLGTARGGFSNREDYEVVTTPVPTPTRPIESAPVSVEIADATKDNRFDVVVADQELDAVTVLPGDGTGRLGEPVNYPVGTFPLKAVVHDLNADGVPDIVAANRVDNTISVLLGSGTGDLEVAGEFAVGPAPLDVVIADFNDDGKPDAVTVNYDGDNLSLLLNTNERPVIPGDLNGDQQRTTADLQLLEAELFDGDGSWALATHRGDVATGAGADVNNGDHQITAADVVALRRRLGR